jgi:hypothetical protein
MVRPRQTRYRSQMSQSTDTDDGWHLSATLTRMAINSVPNMAATAFTREGFVTGKVVNHGDPFDDIGPYADLDAGGMPTDNEIISVPVGEKFTFNADYQGITLQYGDTVVYKPIPEGLHPNQLSAFRINSWFGGTSRAPRTISYYMQLKPWWKTL